MKYIITGRHASGVHQILNTVEYKYQVDIIREFSNIPKSTLNKYKQIYIDPLYEPYDSKDVAKLFDSQMHVCFNTISETGVLNASDYYRGISMYSVDRGTVMAMSYEQLMKANFHNIHDDICIIWLDNSSQNRISRYASEKRKYNFKEQDNIDEMYVSEITDVIYKVTDNILYFHDEDPDRIACILGSCIRYPDLLKEFVEYFQ